MNIFHFFIVFIYSIHFIYGINYDSSESNRSQRYDNIDEEKEVLIVSTLDGSLHGVDVNDGSTLWKILNPPLVSQSLSELEFTKDGKKFRLIPSLEGQLYMLEADGDRKGLHALPITADALFTSSFQLSSDSLLVGGKEQRVIGFNPLNGEIKYRCGKKGCYQAPTFRTGGQSCDLLLCRRINHIVRAVDIDTGIEKWNFSVGQDDVITANMASYPRSPMGGTDQEGIISQGGCVMTSEDDPDKSTTAWYFNVEKGTIQSSSRAPFSVVRWVRDFDSSLSRVWLLRGRSVRPLSIFARDVHSRLEHVADESGCPIRRSLFLGSYEGHMYVQLEDGSARRSPRPLYVALPSAEKHRADMDPASAMRHRVSKVTRYAPVPQYGFFRPSIQAGADTAKKWFTFQDSHECYPHPSDPLVVRFGSFLFQKLVFVCLIVIIGHLAFKKLYLPYQINKLPKQAAPMSDHNNNSCDMVTHVSRYEADYEHVRCLGRGAFGVVFEARHRVDQYHYAVKRVRVRYSPQARDKLLQEVQAFAHLEHPGIVRYYQAWFELPPNGWQEQRDRDLRLTSATDDDGCDTGEGTLTSDSRTESTASLTCENSEGAGWSTRSAADQSRDARSDAGSLIIFDRSTELSRATVSSSSSGFFARSSSLTEYSHDNDIRFHRSRTQSQSDHARSHCNDPHSPNNDLQSHNNTDIQSHSNTDIQSHSNIETQPHSNCSHIYLFISMHLYSGTTLQHRLQQQVDPRPPRLDRLHTFAQIVDAVAYLHNNDLMHRDLKPSNILFDNFDHIRIVDFGLATSLFRTKAASGQRQQRLHEGLHTSNVGTELYMSPEQQKGSQYDQKVDIFALGIIFLELMVPFATAMERAIFLTNARKLQFDAATRASYPDEIAMASELLQHDPARRPTCDAILEHALLAGVASELRTLSRSRSLSASP